MTDKIKFKVAKYNKWFEDGETLHAVIEINDKDFIETVKKIEIKYDKELAGDYSYMKITELFYHLHLTEEGDSYYTNYGTPIVVCEGCGEEGCWSVTVRITTDANYVYWKDFSQNHRDWEYGLSFKFNRKEYENELSKLIRKLSKFMNKNMSS